MLTFASVIKIKGIKTMTSYEKALSLSAIRQGQIEEVADTFIKAIDKTDDVYSLYIGVLYRVHSHIYNEIVAMLSHKWGEEVDVTDCDRFNYIATVGNDDCDNDVPVNSVKVTRDGENENGDYYIELTLDNGNVVAFYDNDEDADSYTMLIDLWLAVAEATGVKK